MPVETPRIGIGTLVAHDVDKDAVTSFLVEAADRLVENLVVIHLSHARVWEDGPIVQALNVQILDISDRATPWSEVFGLRGLAMKSRLKTTIFASGLQFRRFQGR